MVGWIDYHMRIRQNQTVRSDDRTGSTHAGAVIRGADDEDHRGCEALINLLRRRLGRLSQAIDWNGNEECENGTDHKQSHNASPAVPKCTGEGSYSSTVTVER